MSRKCTLCTSATLWETETDKEQKELGEAASEICQAFSRYVSLKQLIWRQMIPLKPLTIFPLFNALQLRKHWHAVDFNKAIKSTQEAKPLPLPDSFVSVFFFFQQISPSTNWDIGRAGFESGPLCPLALDHWAFIIADVSFNFAEMASGSKVQRLQVMERRKDRGDLNFCKQLRGCLWSCYCMRSMHYMRHIHWSRGCGNTP